MDPAGLLWSALDWLLPPHCVGCGEPGTLLCADCLSEVRRLEYGVCRKCGKPLGKTSACAFCARGESAYTRARAVFLYESAVAEGIKRLKFRRNLGLARVFAHELTLLYRRLRWKHDLVVPVPITLARRVRRTYNQAELVAAPFGTQVGIPVQPAALMKIRETREQARLSAEERRQNLREAFASEPFYVRDKKVLLLDDVMTTGSTFEACAQALKAGGAAAVDCISIATVPYAEHTVNQPSAG